MNALNLQAQASEIVRPKATSKALGQIPRQVWLAVHFPKIALSAYNAPENIPFAVFTHVKGKNCIYQANTLAAEQGVSVGMPLTAAYGLCQNLNCAARDVLMEMRYLKRYAQRIAQFTPRIVLAEPDTVLLEVRSSLRLFKGMKNIHAQLKHLFDVPHTIACAPCESAAELMARNGIGKIIRDAGHLQSALGDILIQSSAINAKTAQHLARCGLYQLRDLWRLPRPDLARRFGVDVLDYLDQLKAERSAPGIGFEQVERFQTQHDFEQEVESSQTILNVAESLLFQAQSFLKIRASLAEKVTFRLLYAHYNHDVKKWLTLDIYAQKGGDSIVHFLPQLQEQLQTVQLEKPVISLNLHIDQFNPRVDTTQDLFKKSVSALDDWPSLLDVLIARLGLEKVYRLKLFADHRPEQAWRKDSVRVTKKRKNVKPNSVTRPAYLFNQPTQCLGSRYRLISAPERLEVGWWDEQDIRREYYQAIAPSGRRCWVFRDLQAVNQQWYVHGLFA